MDRLFMRSQIITLIILLISLLGCEQVPSTMDEMPYLEDPGEITFSATISSFEYDFLMQQFHFSVEITSPLEIHSVTAELTTSGLQDFTFGLNDLGQGSDILVGDGIYDGSLTLPDSLTGFAENSWILSVEARDVESNSLMDSKSLQPQKPAPPFIGTADHLDTLILSTSDLVLDTLTLEVSHPNGLDEIRDVSMMSLKPDGTYANEGQPIPLYDDGGTEVFYSFGGIDFTSGDSLANDGVYSLLLALAPNNLSGVYLWTFNARTWLGIEATPVQDSIIVLPAGSLAKSLSYEPAFSEVFN